MLRRLVLPAMMLTFLPSCNLTLGPQAKTEVVIVRAGKPVQIIENKTVKARRIDDDTIVKVDVGGWVALPQEHWEAVKRALESAKEPETNAGATASPIGPVPQRGIGWRANRRGTWRRYCELDNFVFAPQTLEMRY